MGGVERAVEEIAVRLAANGHDVTVYCRTSYATSRQPTYRGVRLRYLPAVDTKHLEAISHSLLATIDAIRRRYDIVHFHALGPGLCAPLARAAGLPVVTTVHRLDFRAGKWGLLARAVLRVGARVAARVPQRTIVVSRQLQQWFDEEYGRAATYVPNGVDVPVEPAGVDAALNGRGRHFLFLGRLVPEKDVDTLIEAYRGVTADLELVIAGAPSRTEDYESRLRRLAAGDARIRFTGAVYGEDKRALVGHTFAFCQPSSVEGLPIALLEMMADGVCPIVSDIPEHLEVVTSDDGDVAAIVFRVGDPQSLREALTTALERPRMVAERGRAARRLVVGRYRWDDVVESLQRVYSEVAKP